MIERIGPATLYLGDAMSVMPNIGKVAAIVTDPPYQETSLAWDKKVDGWWRLANTPQIWAFGSMRFWMNSGAEFTADGWKLSQELIWEKHNGSTFHNDRFRRVHEHVLHWYQGKWSNLHHETPVTHDAKKRTIARSNKPTHMNAASGGVPYRSEEGGPRLMRSVLKVRSTHGHAEHPTQKPVDVLKPLIEYSVKPRGLVLDPFMGSGSTGVACIESGRRFIGIEKNKKYFHVACRRVEAALAARRKDVDRR